MVQGVADAPLGKLVQAPGGFRNIREKSSSHADEPQTDHPPLIRDPVTHHAATPSPHIAAAARPAAVTR